MKASEILREDIRSLVSRFPFNSLIRGKTILITGATGLIGSMLVRILLSLNEMEEEDIKIIAPVRNPEKAHRLFGDVDVKWVSGDITEPITIDEKIDYIFHCANVTTSKFMTDHPAQTLLSTFNGTDNLLRLAREKRVESMVYLSSIESYGSFDEEREILEDASGYINPLNPRSCYPLGKKAAECLCYSYFAEYGVPVKIARLTQTFGAGVSPDDKRVFAQFARSAINGEDIILHTTGESSKPYCYTTDAVSALFYILMKGKNGDAYNVANPATYTSIREMAEIVAENFGDGSSVRVELHDDMGYAPTTKSRLNSEKLMELGWKPEYDLKDMYSRLISYFKESDKLR